MVHQLAKLGLLQLDIHPRIQHMSLQAVDVVRLLCKWSVLRRLLHQSGLQDDLLHFSWDSQRWHVVVVGVGVVNSGDGPGLWRVEGCEGQQDDRLM